MPRLAALALALVLAGCDWPVLDLPEDPAVDGGPWPVIADDATLGIGAAAAPASEPPDLSARRAALDARAAALAAP